MPWCDWSSRSNFDGFRWQITVGQMCTSAPKPTNIIGRIGFSFHRQSLPRLYDASENHACLGGFGRSTVAACHKWSSRTLTRVMKDEEVSFAFFQTHFGAPSSYSLHAGMAQHVEAVRCNGLILCCCWSDLPSLRRRANTHIFSVCSCASGWTASTDEESRCWAEGIESQEEQTTRSPLPERCWWQSSWRTVCRRSRSRADILSSSRCKVKPSLWRKRICCSLSGSNETLRDSAHSESKVHLFPWWATCASQQAGWETSVSACSWKVYTRQSGLFDPARLRNDFWTVLLFIAQSFSMSSPRTMLILLVSSWLRCKLILCDRDAELTRTRTDGSEKPDEFCRDNLNMSSAHLIRDTRRACSVSLLTVFLLWPFAVDERDETAHESSLTNLHGCQSICFHCPGEQGQPSQSDLPSKSNWTVRTRELPISARAHMEGLTFNAHTEQEETREGVLTNSGTAAGLQVLQRKQDRRTASWVTRAQSASFVLRIENNIVATPETSWTQMTGNVPGTVREAKTRVTSHFSHTVDDGVDKDDDHQTSWSTPAAMLTGWIWYESHSCRGCVGDFTQYKVVCPLMNVREDSCNSLAVHVLDFLKVTSLSNADDAGQLLEFVFGAILSPHAKTACAKFGLYFLSLPRSS